MPLSIGVAWVQNRVPPRRSPPSTPDRQCNALSLSRFFWFPLPFLLPPTARNLACSSSQRLPATDIAPFPLASPPSGSLDRRMVSRSTPPKTPLRSPPRISHA